jgi:two-component system NtrC family sensor kinase
VESALNMLRNELRYRTLVERQLDARQPVRGSAGRLAQVFVNLILNAAQALPEGNLDGNRLRVRTFDEGTGVVIEVEDNGPGIPAEVMPRIFESFFTTKPAGVGTGLGLPISREIIRSLEGELIAENLPGGGALFRVRVPAVDADEGDEATPVPVQRRRRCRIVAIDDEALLLKAYRRMLLDHHDLVTRVGAAEALRLFAEDRGFEVILCDLQMPDMSGAELYKVVRDRWPELASRFIFVTGGAFSTEARRFLDESVITCLNKPFQLEELLTLIEARVTR